MQLLKSSIVLMASFVFGSTLTNLTLTPEAQAATKLKMAAPIGEFSLVGENPTCFIQLPGQPKQTLDKICGTNDPKPNRKRDRNELDRDGIPFVMKENFRRTQEIQRQLQEAHAKLEREMPVSDNVLRLKEQQRQLSEQYMNSRNSEERNRLQKQLEQTSRQLQADPSLQKSYELMRKLYQSDTSRGRSSF